MSMYRCNFDLLAKAMAYFSPLISFPRFIYFEPSFEASEFPIAFRTELYYFYNTDTAAVDGKIDSMCISVYLVIDQIDILAQLVLRMQNCYKILVNCFYDYDIWTGEDALIIDKCSQSTKTEITVYKRELGPFETIVHGNPYED